MGCATPQQVVALESREPASSVLRGEHCEEVGRRPLSTQPWKGTRVGQQGAAGGVLSPCCRPENCYQRGESFRSWGPSTSKIDRCIFDNTAHFGKNAAFSAWWVKFCIRLNFIWVDSVYDSGWCSLHGKFIVTAPSRFSSMNLRSRLIVNAGYSRIGSLASVTVNRRLEVPVIGFLFWLLILQEMLLCLWLAARVLTSLYYPVLLFCAVI